MRVALVVLACLCAGLAAAVKVDVSTKAPGGLRGPPLLLVFTRVLGVGSFVGSVGHLI